MGISKTRKEKIRAFLSCKFADYLRLNAEYYRRNAFRGSFVSKPYIDYIDLVKLIDLMEELEGKNK